MNASSLVAVALASSACLCGCLYVRARVLEYIRLRAMLKTSTNQVINSLINDRDELFRGIWFAIYKLGGTGVQRYVMRRAVLASPLARSWPIIKYIIGKMPKYETEVKDYFFPVI